MPTKSTRGGWKEYKPNHEKSTHQHPKPNHQDKPQEETKQQSPTLQQLRLMALSNQGV